MASAAEHGERGTLVAGLPAVPAGIPVVFVWGVQSPFPKRTTPDTAALIPHARVEAIEGAGHFVWLEQPRAFLAAVDM
jgi:pimeloyl-ACP methyl ester carboxylesterase